MFTLSHWLKGLAVSRHFHLIHGHAHCCLSVLFLLTCYFLLDFTFLLFLLLTMTDSDSMKNPCATPQSGALSAWTIAHPTQVMSPTSWSSQAPLSSTTQPPATSTSRTPSTTQPLYPTPFSTTTSSVSYSQSWSIERGNLCWKGAIAIIFLVVSET